MVLVFIFAAAAVILVSLVADRLRRKRIRFDNVEYSRHQMNKIVASVIRKDRRRPRYGINA